MNFCPIFVTQSRAQPFGAGRTSKQSVDSIGLELQGSASDARPRSIKLPVSGSRLPQAVTRPGLLQTRTCGFPASGSSCHGFAVLGFQG